MANVLVVSEGFTVAADHRLKPVKVVFGNPTGTKPLG